MAVVIFTILRQTSLAVGLLFFASLRLVVIISVLVAATLALGHIELRHLLLCLCIYVLGRRAQGVYGCLLYGIAVGIVLARMLSLGFAAMELITFFIPNPVLRDRLRTVWATLGHRTLDDPTPKSEEGFLHLVVPMQITLGAVLLFLGLRAAPHVNMSLRPQLPNLRKSLPHNPFLRQNSYDGHAGTT